MNHIYLRLVIGLALVFIYGSEIITEKLKKIMFIIGVLVATIAFIVTFFHSGVAFFSMIWGSMLMSSCYLLWHCRCRGIRRPHMSDIDKDTWIELVFYICMFIIVLSIWR